MATLLSTTVPDNGYYRVGTSTNKAFVSAGSFGGVQLAHFGNDAWWNGSTWVSGSGPVIQISNTTITFITTPTSGINAFTVLSGTTTLASTTTTVVKTSGNTTTNSTLGVGAAAGPAAADGKILVNAGDTAKPFLEVTNCDGSGGASPSTSTYSIFKGFLGIKIGANVGPATSVATGTYYIRLWNNT
jgi:hypothetical protein